MSSDMASRSAAAAAQAVEYLTHTLHDRVVEYGDDPVWHRHHSALGWIHTAAAIVEVSSTDLY